MLIAATITTAGIVYYQHAATDRRNAALESLSIAADLKAKQIASWINERRGDAEVARASEIIRGIVTNPGTDEARPATPKPLQVFRNVYRYAGVIVTDSAGKSIFKDPADLRASATTISERAAAALRSGKVMISTLESTSTDDGRYFWVSGPVFAGPTDGEPPIGAVLLAADPRVFLFPTLAVWSTPSKSAEALLLIRDGDYAVCLNDLRTSESGSGRPRIPLHDDPLVPAARAVQGYEGVIDGRDYRGIHVLAVCRKIEDTPWSLVVKMDKKEILAPVYHEAWTIGIITALSVVAAVLGLGAVLRRRKLEELGESARRFRVLIEKAPVAVCISRGVSVLYANPKYLEMYGIESAAELKGRPVTEQWVPEFRPIIEDRIARRRRGEAVPSDYEGPGQRKDGTRIFVQVHIGTIELPDGNASLAFLTDISARKAAEESRAQLASIVQSSDDAVASKTLAGIVLTWNKSAERLFGYKAEEIVGQPMLLVFPADRVSEEPEILARIARGETVEHVDTVRKAKDGKLIDVSVTISPMFDDNGKVVGASTIARDITARKRTEESLQLFRALLNRANDSIEVVEPNTGRFLDVNERAVEIHGYTRDEYLALTVSDVDPVYPAVGTLEWNTRMEALQKAGAMVFESEHRRKDSSLFPVEINASYVRLERDYVLTIVRDITERKRTEGQIRRLNRLYAVLSQINELIVREKDSGKLFQAACQIAVEKGGFRMSWVGWLDELSQKLIPIASAGFVNGYLDTVNIDLNDAARVLGPSARALLTGEHQICHDMASDPVMAPWRAAALERGYASSAAFALKVAGKVVGAFTLYSAETGFFDSDEIRLLSELAADIAFALEVHQQEAERKEAMQARQASEVQFSTAFEMASIGMALVAPDGRWLKANPVLCHMVGYKPSELYGMTFQDITYLEDLDNDIENTRALLDGHIASYRAEKRYVRKDGQLIWVLLNTALVRDDAGNPIHFISQIQDITESRRLADQLRQAQKMEAIGQLAGGVAHDFNNILGTIMLQAQLAMGLEGTPKETEEGLEQIVIAAERAANIIGQLLLFSRKQVMQARNLDLNDVVTELSKMLRRFIGEDVRLELRLSSKPVITFADPGMVDQILLNLAVNARDAMPDGGKLLVETGELDVDASFAQKLTDAKVGSYVWMDVSDTGIGIAPEILPRIFEPFFTTKDPGKGTGLGLATVFGTVKQHGGFLTVESQMGRGTKFRIFLPASETQLDLQVAEAKPKPQGGSETILLVEDENLIRSVMRSMLERAGYRIIEASDGEEALRLWSSETSRVHLLLTDLVMPAGLTGHQLALQLRREKPDLKVILMSGYSADIAGRQVDLGEGERFLKKPFTPDRLLETIRQLLDPA